VKNDVADLSYSLKHLGTVDVDSNDTRDLYEITPKRLSKRVFPPLRLTTSQSGPTGKVTLLFTDIQGSTAQWEADAETMEKSLALHNKLFRDLMKEYGGYEV
jgi:class 3 adenylate cyclase